MQETPEHCIYFQQSLAALSRDVDTGTFVRVLKQRRSRNGSSRWIPSAGHYEPIDKYRLTTTRGREIESF